MKRMIPLEYVQEILLEEGWEETEHIGVAPRSDNLGEEYWGIFEYESCFWRTKFTQGNSYWQSEMGQWEDPFPVEYGATEIECELVYKVPVTTYKFEPLP